MQLIYKIIFLFITLYFLLQLISYGIYEKREENNTSGGNTIILLGIFSFLFSNIMIWINL